MNLNRRDRRAIDRAFRKALKTDYGSCELIDGTTIVITRNCWGCSSGGVKSFPCPQQNQIDESTQRLFAIESGP